MKLLLPILSLLFLMSCDAANKMTAIDYNDKIIQEQTKITKLTLELINNIETDLGKCEEFRKKTIDQCEASIKVVEAMSDYEGNTRMRNAAVALFKFYKDINENEYKEMLDILAKEETITEEDLTRLQTLEQEIGQRETGLDNEFQMAQQEFAQKHNLQIQDNELQKEIDKI